MTEQQNVIDCYNRTAAAYAAQFMNELEQKNLDKLLLKQFATENAAKGRIADIGCGPGQVTQFLTTHQFTNILGIDLSPQMVKVAKQLNPNADFEAGDMLALNYADGSFGSVIALYAIVHLGHNNLITAFKELYRVLVPSGQLLLSFHIGDERIHRDTFLEQEVDIDFIFYKTEFVTTQLTSAGFKVIDVIERQAYPGVEYPSKRAYLWLQK